MKIAPIRIIKLIKKSFERGRSKGFQDIKRSLDINVKIFKDSLAQELKHRHNDKLWYEKRINSLEKKILSIKEEYEIKQSELQKDKLELNSYMSDLIKFDESIKNKIQNISIDAAFIQKISMDIEVLYKKVFKFNNKK